MGVLEPKAVTRSKLSLDNLAELHPLLQGTSCVHKGTVPFKSNRLLLLCLLGCLIISASLNGREPCVPVMCSPVYKLF